jgi:hypothetical protein
MKKKTVLCALVLAVACAACVKAQNYDSENDFRIIPVTAADLAEITDNFFLTGPSGGGRFAVITKYVGNKQIVNIPPRIAGLPVIGILENMVEGGVFEGTKIVRVTIPEGV